MSASEGLSNEAVEVANMGSEGKRIITDLHRLREAIVNAWQERGVILTQEEQKALRQEIKQTCDLLSALVDN